MRLAYFHQDFLGFGAEIHHILFLRAAGRGQLALPLFDRHLPVSRREQVARMSSAEGCQTKSHKCRLVLGRERGEG